MLNKCCFIGNLGRDPEARQMNNGDTVVNLSLAVSEKWKDKSSGERRERTEWVRVVIFNEHLAKVAQQYLKKGSKVYLEGQLQTRIWTDKDGNDRYSTEIVLQRYRGELVMLDGKREEGEGHDARTAGQSEGYVVGSPQDPQAPPEDDGERIPF